MVEQPGNKKGNRRTGAVLAGAICRGNTGSRYAHGFSPARETKFCRPYDKI